MRTLKTLVVFLAMASITTGCLKTRAQIRQDEDDTDDSSRPVPAKVENVEPEGDKYTIDEIKEEITRLEGRIEDVERAQQQQAQNGQNKQDVKLLNDRVAQLEQTQASVLEQLKKLQESQVPAKEPTEAFDKGKKQYNAQNYDAAVELFSTYLKYPKGKHIQEATFLRAESYYQLKQYKKAIIDYSKFPEKFPTSKHMSVSLYKIGLCFDALGMHDDAKGFYQELVEKYPKTPEAKKARPKLRK